MFETREDRGPELSARLGGTLSGKVVQELFSNSAHFPIANILFELLNEGAADYLGDPDFYAICAAALIQAYVLGRGEFTGRRPAFFGNLVGPAVYTVIEVIFEGVRFFEGAHHIAYWVFALAIGILQAVRAGATPRSRDAIVVVENVLRAGIIAVMYWIFEARGNPEYASVAGFMQDPSHVFVVFAAPLMGVLLGFANIAHLRRVMVLASTAGQLRSFSEWSMGSSLVARAVADPGILDLRREERAVLFMDIRGFTRWTEPQQPEAVVEMLDAYFAAAEGVWSRHDPIISRLIADEVMLVLPEPGLGLRVADELREATKKALAPFGLDAGIGLNWGPLMEGMIGSPSIRAYDIIGDTANTAARLCSAAEPGEILVPTALAQAHSDIVTFGSMREIAAKGKREPLKVCSIQSVVRG
ncbi:MAG: adenylate/guanylate cyclase domain-containing protein [Rhodospirillales bacterium]|jgi:adenylate cyclase|nr:adenylate/guanylate cyclase domain-containing protein [Rhodospirillales bacterium]